MMFLVKCREQKRDCFDRQELIDQECMAQTFRNAYFRLTIILVLLKLLVVADHFKKIVCTSDHYQNFV